MPQPPEPEIETRSALPAEIRAGDNGVSIVGYAAVVSEEADIGGMWKEVIAPGAFRAAIGRDDVVFLINHEGEPLARTGSGTLQLSEDSRGLRIESTLDASDPDVQRLIPKMKRGDLSKMSFAFRATKQSWDDTTEPPTRTIEEVILRDVSVVNAPAYAGTDIALRSLEAARTERRQHNFNAAANRVAMKVSIDLRERGAVSKA